MSERKVNKDGWLWLAPEYFNRWRVFPRAFIIFYFWLAFETAMWFMGLPNPSPAQAAFAASIISAGAAWFGLYVNSGSMTSRNTPMPNDYNYQSPQPVAPQYNRPGPDSEIDNTGIPPYKVRGE